MKKLKNPPGEYAQYYSLAVEFAVVNIFWTHFLKKLFMLFDV